MISWTLEYDGQERPLDRWGIRNPQLTFRSLDLDELTFDIVREDVLGAATFPYDADLILRRNGVRWFRGRVALPSAHGGARNEGESYRVVGPWWFLERIVYQQAWTIRDETFAAVVNEDTSRVTLGQNAAGTRIAASAQITAIVAYALSLDAPIAAGTVPVLNEVPIAEERDITCAQAIRKMLQWSPDVVSWFDYTAATPTLNFQKRASLTAVAIDATAGTRLAEFSGLAPRNDLVPPGVRFIYPIAERNPEDPDGDGRTYTRIEKDSAGSPDEIGGIIATIELHGYGPLSDNPETPPVGLAAAYYTALQTVGWQGVVTLLEEDCTGDVRPGKVVNITNGRAAWATMNAVVQIVTEELGSGLTTIELGPPEHLGPQDFVAQQQFARRRLTPTAFPESQHNGATGEGAVDNDNAGVDPGALAAELAAKKLPKTDAFLQGSGSEGAGFITLTVCEEGEESCVRVPGVSVSCS